VSPPLSFFISRLPWGTKITLILIDISSGCEPLTPGDIAEVIVFAAGRRENVVVADTLLFPNHQASATIMHRRGA
jgi:hypothetical protein